MRSQSGLQRGLRAPNIKTARGLLLRGVVLRVYHPDDPDHPAKVATLARYGDPVNGRMSDSTVQRSNGTPSGWYCDVLTYGSGFRSVFFSVPVAQEIGRSDVWGNWRPRGTSRSSDQRAANALSETPNDPRKLDGDHVLISFLEGDFNQPIIIRGLPHPQAEEKVPAFAAYDATKGPPSEYLVRHRGTVLRIDSFGNVLISSAESKNGHVDDAGAEDTAGEGDITLRTQNAHTARVEAPSGSVELTSSTAAATRKVARVDDTTKALVGGTILPPGIIPPTSPANPAWDEFFALVAVALDTAAGGIAFQTAYVAARNAGIVGGITSGHDDVRTD